MMDKGLGQAGIRVILGLVSLVLCLPCLRDHRDHIANTLNTSLASARWHLRLVLRSFQLLRTSPLTPQGGILPGRMVASQPGDKSPRFASPQDAAQPGGCCLVHFVLVEINKREKQERKVVKETNFINHSISFYNQKTQWLVSIKQHHL